jgi:electron transport complex protein RnfB
MDLAIILGVLGGLGAVFGVVLPILQLKLAPKEDPLLIELVKMLPGANCGSCGNPGCEGFAKTLLNGTQKELKTCRPGAKSKNYPLILAFLKEHGIPDVL